MVQTGLEVFLKHEYRQYQNCTIGLITNHSACDRNLLSAADLIYQNSSLKLKVLFAPEHGLRGQQQAGEKIKDGIDPQTSLPVKSLYGENLALQEEMIDGLDLVILDLSDIGSRFYTYIYTMAAALKAVSKSKKKMLILDRPNPIAPLGITGNIIEPALNSFVGGFNLPITPSFTIGELANYFNNEFKINADLEIVKMKGWERNMWYKDTGLSFVPPSPNIPTFETTVIYPGTCLIEGTNLSEGRGTTKPFEQIGAPWVDPFKLAKELNSLLLAGVIFRPIYFCPQFSKHQNQQLGGVQVHITDINEIQPVEVGLSILSTVFKMYQQCAWIDLLGDKYIDLLAGSRSLRGLIQQGITGQEIYQDWENSLACFKDKSKQYYLYGG